MNSLRCHRQTTPAFASLLTLGALTISLPTQAATQFTGQYWIINKHSGRALDVAEFSRVDGGNVQQWQYAGSDNQLWTLRATGNGTYTLQAKHSGKYLDVASASRTDGANIQQWTGNGTVAQQFRVEDIGGGLYRIINSGSGKALDVSGFSQTNGGNIQQWTWTGNNNQKWEIIPYNADTGLAGLRSLRSKFNQRAIDIKEASTANAARAHTWDYVNAANQKWNLEYVGSGYYKVRAQHSKQVLDVANASLADGVFVQQYPDNGNDAQLFAFIRNGNSWQIRNRHSGKVLEIDGWANYNGAPIVQRSANGQDHQAWTVAAADATSPTPPGGGGSGRCTTLRWSDEFNGSGLPDASKWSFDVRPPGWVNREWQNYTDRRTENARVENGRLVIEARRDWFGGHEISSARLVSAGKGDFTYGRVEARIKQPVGRGTWPAFWMLPTDWSYGGWPNSGEIDIMEHVGYSPDMIYGSVHTRDRNHAIGTQFTIGYRQPGVESTFNVYAIEWFPDRIDFYFNGIKYTTYRNDGAGVGTWPFDKRFHMILNLAIGGDWGAAQGVDMNIFPARMEVDYVRVFGCN